MVAFASQSNGHPPLRPPAGARENAAPPGAASFDPAVRRMADAVKAAQTMNRLRETLACQELSDEGVGLVAATLELLEGRVMTYRRRVNEQRPAAG